MANIKNFGIKGVASDVQMGKGGGFVVYDSANGRFEFKDNGNSLENVQFATVEAGAWNGTEIGVAYGGTGLTTIASDQILYTTGADTFGTANITATGLSLLDSVDASSGRTTLGLGNVSTQADNAIAFTGGTIDGVTIGGSTAGAITGTTITANSGFTGDLTGNVTGDLTGNADSADAWSTARDLGLAGDASGNVSIDGSADATLTLTLGTSGVTAGDYGSATQIPTFTVDAKGRITAASNVAVSTGFDIAGDNGSNDTVAGGETLTFAGTASQIETTITDNNVEIGIVDGASIANLTVTGTFTSDDITSAAISIDGDATITGNLTVQGTQTTVNSTTVETADAIFRTNSNGANTDAGFEANTASGVKQILYTSVGQEWDFGSEGVKANSFTGDLTGNVTGNVTGDITGDVTGDVTGNVTGTVSDISNHDTDSLAEGSTNLYFTDARANSAMDGYLVGGTGLTYGSGQFDLDNTAVTAGDYGSATQIPTFTVDAQGRITAAANVAISTSWSLTDGTTTETVDGGDTLTISSDSNVTAVVSATDTLTVGLANTLSGLVSVSSTAFTGDLTGDVTGNVSGNAGTASAWETARDLGLAGDATGNVSIDGSGDATLTVTLANTGVTAGNVGSSTAIPVLTIDADGRISAASTASIQTSFTLAGDTGSDTIDGGDTLTVTGGNNITTSVALDAVTVDLDADISLTSVTATGAVEGGSVTDGTATLTGGALSGATTGAFSGNVSAGNFTSAGKVDVASLETSGDATIGGNLIVNGTTTTLSSTNTTVEDTLFELNSGASSSTGDIGMLFQRGSTGDNAFMGWDESEDEFVVGTTTALADATGDLTIADANLRAATVKFVDLSDGTITISAFVDEDDMNSDSDTMVPTQQSVKAYVDSKVAAVDDTVLRATFTADSTNSSFTLGTMPNTAGRTYIGSKLTIKVTTAFSGGSVDGILVNDGTNDLMAVAQNDPTVTGLYVVDLGAEGIAAGATVTVSFKQSDGTTASIPTAGACTATMEYQFYT